MSDQYRDPYDPYGQQQPPQQPRQPQQPQQHQQQPQHDTYGQHAPHEPYYGAQQGAYDYGYAPQQQPAPQDQAAAWPAAGGQQQGRQGYAPVDEPTQTWETPSWDAQSWQQQLPVTEPSYGGPAQTAAQNTWGAPQEQPAPAYRPEPAPAHAPAPAPAPAPVLAQEPARPLTAAEKARAEGRPQILSPGFRPALLTAVLAALTAVAAHLGQYALAVPVVLLQAVTAAGWFRLNGMWPARQGIALAFLGGLAADAGLLATERVHAPTVVIGTLGVWLLLVVVLQLRSHAGADERLYGLTTAAASSALAVLAAGHLAAEPDAVVVGALAVAATALARALPLPSLAAPVIALAAAAGAGVLGGQLVHAGPSAALLGLAAGVCALAGLRAASYDYPSRFVHMTAGVALPLALASPAVYVVGRMLF
ncbi:hypothetical protein I5Q34_18085 [Streptomyces sp. AV19]|uniref:hypothetical protein n=1 Tax=Streptomyces sp. AV19 TaxID=2793068 RepID=UPI0018FEDEEA|nr:hypothetical protein [Streptomyces sp. AV19]MBH1936157.1 hypothetical protein [Streptomyces sp. AV19]MDG4534662.1 hypothetical protein [Streptomyces sp. AV19]